MVIRYCSIWMMISLLLSNFAPAQQQSGAQMLRNVEKVYEGLNDFSAGFEAEVNMERLRMPKVQGKIYFKKPDKLSIDSKNFAMIPREGFMLNPTVLLEKYDVTLVGPDSVHGLKHHKLQLAAKEGSTRLRQLFLWVHPQSWTIAKMETVPAEGRTMMVVYEYAMINSLPLMKTIMVEFGSVNPEPPDTFMETNPDFTPRADRMKRALETGMFKVTLSDHIVNAGIPDQQFERPPVPSTGQVGQTGKLKE